MGEYRSMTSRVPEGYLVDAHWAYVPSGRGEILWAIEMGRAMNLERTWGSIIQLLKISYIPGTYGEYHTRDYVQMFEDEHI